MWNCAAELLERFELIALLGEGGVARVYSAWDKRLGRKVALKLLPERVARNQEVVERFKHEAHVVGSLDHVNIATLYDFLVFDQQPALVMQLIDGETLERRIKSGRLEILEILTLYSQVARALEAAHSHGIVHRDLKPSNIMLTDSGCVKVLDFGIAQSLGQLPSDEAYEISGDVSAEEGDTRMGGLAGTAAFMSPEHIRGEAADFCDDIWAFGCCLYHGLTRVLPFRGKTETEVLGAALEQEPDWARLPASVPSEVVVILRMCLQKSRRGRLSSARDLAVMLEGAIEGIRAGDSDGGGWAPKKEALIPGRPNWVLEKRLGAGRYGEAWLASHTTTRSRRVFKFCMDPEHVRALKREVTLFRVIRESLGHRDDIAQVIDWQLKAPPYFIEIEYTDTGDLRAWAAERGGIEKVSIETRLELVAQAADAVAAAHSAGVLHKDIKPGNILVAQASNATRPKARLTDFGIGLLADPEAAQRESLTTSSLTDDLNWTEGKAAGTRMYVAPEVAEGRNASTRSDIYALGVLLYQMAVGNLEKVIAPGWERQIDDELLREDIAHCVEGAPELRLDSATTLAERIRGLERRRRALEEGRLERRLAERAHHRRRLYLSGTVASLAVAAVVVAFAWRERQRFTEEQHLRKRAELSSIAAQNSKSEALESMNQARAERARADENYRLAREAVDNTVARISKTEAIATPGLQEYRYELLEGTLVYYQSFLESGSDDRGLRADIAWARFMVAAIELELDHGDWAEDLSEGLTLLEKLVEEGASQEDLGRLTDGVWRPSVGITGHWPRALRREPESSLVLFERAEESLTMAVQQYPGVRGFESDLAFCSFVKGYLLDDYPEEAVNAYKRCLEIWSQVDEDDPNELDCRLGISRSHDRMAKLYQRLGMEAEARQSQRESSEMYLMLRSSHPDSPAVTAAWANHCVMMGVGLLEFGDYSDARESLQSAVDANRRLMSLYPEVTDYKIALARAYARLGEVHLALNEPKEAHEMFELVALHDKRGGPLNHAAWLLANHSDPKRRDVARARRFAEQAVALDATRSQYQATLGAVRYRLGDLERANRSLLKAVELRRNESQCAEFFLLSMIASKGGNTEGALDWYDRGIAWMEETNSTDEEMQRLRTEAEETMESSSGQTALARYAEEEITNAVADEAP